MHYEIEQKRFQAVDAAGKSYSVLATRKIAFEFGSLPQKQSWTFYIDDGSFAQFDGTTQTFLVGSSGVRLRSADPNLPDECRGGRSAS